MWSKNGSLPQHITDGTPGWIEVPDMPAPVEGKEIVWLNNEWVIRDPMPERRAGYVWKWIHDTYEWRECKSNVTYTLDPHVAALTSADLALLTTEQIDILKSLGLRNI